MPPLNEVVFDEGVMRELGNWMRDHMVIYPSGVALAAHMPELIREHVVHALGGRCEEKFHDPPK